jgi:hypothetical protein
MTATNHAITGAVMAVIVKQPWLAIPLAFLSHFAMDTIPHFGIATKDVFARNKNRTFLKILISDCFAAAILLIIVPWLLHDNYQWWAIFLCMFACMSPDLVWGIHFYQEVKNKIELSKGWFSNFHKWVQWSETQKGAYVESIWFLAMILIVISKL